MSHRRQRVLERVLERVFERVLEKVFKRVFVIIFLGCCFVAADLAALETAGSGITEGPELEVRLQLLQGISHINDSLKLNVSVINRDTKPLTFHLSPFAERNFRFRVHTLRNIHVKHSKEFRLRVLKRRHRDPAPRKVVLMPGEQYARTFNLAERFQLDTPDSYLVTARFYIRPRASAQDWFARSNALRFLLRPRPLVAQKIREHEKREAQERGARLSPAETIEFLLKAKQNRNWENYFLYIDEERLINSSFRDFRKKYQEAPFGQKKAVIEEFREFFKNYPGERLEYFFVDRVVVDRDEETANEDAEVVCRIHYRHSGSRSELVEKKIYHFRLYKKRERWYVYSYYVQNVN